jgi:hypothetical protein
VEKRVTTLSRLPAKLAGNTSLRKIIMQLGLEREKIKSNQAVLTVRNDITRENNFILGDNNQFRKERRNVIFVDESNIHSSRVKNKSWSDDRNNGLLTPLSEFQTLIIIHMGRQNGFLPNVLLMWK